MFEINPEYKEAAKLKFGSERWYEFMANVFSKEYKTLIKPVYKFNATRTMKVDPMQFVGGEVYVSCIPFKTCSCIRKRVCCQDCNFHCGVDDKWPAAMAVKTYMAELLRAKQSGQPENSDVEDDQEETKSTPALATGQ